MTLRTCSIDIIPIAYSGDCVSIPAFIFESLAIFFCSPSCSDANNRMLNELLGTIV